MTPETCWYKEVCRNDCSESCIRYQEMYSLCEKSGLPESRWYNTPLWPDDDDYVAFTALMSIKERITDFVDMGKNLYIYSPITGNGKTTWSIKLLLAYFNQIWAGNGFRCRGLFIHAPTFLTQLKDFNSVNNELNRIKNELGEVDLVVWDDIASTNLSSYDHSQLLTYLDRRILAGKSNIFTGNLSWQEMNKSLGTRLTSRVWNNSDVFEFRGGDKR